MWPILAAIGKGAMAAGKFGMAMKGMGDSLKSGDVQGGWNKSKGLSKLLKMQTSGQDIGFYGHNHPADHKCSVNTKGSPDCNKSTKSRDTSKFGKL